MSNYNIPAPWRIVARANPFVPWVFIEKAWRLEDAVTRAEQIKRTGKFYAVHVRPQ